MNNEFLDRTVISKVEELAVAALKVLLATLVAIATIAVWVLFVYAVRTHASRVDSIETLLPLMQRSFAGVLTVVLGLELLETLRAYFRDHHVKLEVILIVAIIAVGRHVIQVDFEHAPAATLLGLAGVIIALTAGYFLVSKARKPDAH
jgi:uncharacterized membrane protein (DUF373 family)